MNTRNSDNVNDVMIKNSVVSEGNQARLAKLMRKAMQGEEVVVVTFGGSITQGASAMNPTLECYSIRVLQWWQNTFPDGKFKLINAGIGATNSAIGVHRIGQDVLSQHPDLVIIEFAVNDKPTDLELLGTYEGIVRRLLENSDCAILLLFMATRSKITAQPFQSAIGLYYDLPMISYLDAYGNTDFWESQTLDGIHPLSDGHARVAILINAFMKKVLDNVMNIKAVENQLPSNALTVNGKYYIGAHIIPLNTDIEEVTIKSSGAFVQSNIEYKAGHADISANHSYYGYTFDGSSSGPIIITLGNCRNLFLLMKRNETGGIATVSVNGGLAIVVDGYYKSSKGIMWASQQLYHSDEADTVTVTIMPPLDKRTFSMLGLLVS